MERNLIFNELKKIIPENRLIYDEQLLEKYSTDESGGKFSVPLVACLPENEEEVVEIIKFSYKEKIPVVPRGKGTGLSGGAIPVVPSIIISTELLDRIIEIDKENFTVKTQPGIITGDLKRRVEEFDLFYPPDPASLDSCSIGGNVAENSGGPSAVKYGTTKDYVKGIKVITPEGEILKFGGKVRKNATGYNLKDIFIGSEGTLGFITEITLSLLPLPKYSIDLLLAFEKIDDATNAVVKIIHSGILPSSIEFMEKKALEAAKNFLGNQMASQKGEAQILLRIDGFEKDLVNRNIETIDAISSNLKCVDILVAEDKNFQEKIWKARRSLHDAMVMMSVKREREDVVVPVNSLPDLIKNIHKIEDKYRIPIITFGHAGDGNVHINILKLDEKDKNFDNNIENVLKEIMELSVKLGGKLSGEHGIGIYKKKFMKLVFTDQEIKIQKNIKKLFDPENLFNPGKIFPDD
ncbi:MAG: FAD-linked oxidase C-terminal domain-containing protein [candidate division WOR-3 bacterium]